MRILLFGATGGTGRNVVKQGLKQGHHITAFVRNPAGLPIQNQQLSIVKGNILDAQQVADAIQGQEIVMSVLGNKATSVFTKPNTIISDGLKHIIAGMEKNKVQRLLFVASFGVNKEIFLPEKLFLRIVLKHIFADIPLQEKRIKKSNLNWTIVHPARLTNGPKTGIYKASEHLRINPFSHISRPDIADFLLKNVTDNTFLHKTVTISY